MLLPRSQATACYSAQQPRFRALFPPFLKETVRKLPKIDK